MNTEPHVMIDRVRTVSLALLMAGLVAAACSSQGTGAALTRAECLDMGGTVIGDPGDGRVYRPDYRCPSGQRPLGPLEFQEGEPIPVEGAVCCPELQ